MQTQNKPDGLYRLSQIVPDQIPVSKSTWWQWVREGRAPKPIRLGPNVTVWKASDIQKFVSDMA
ncbi:MAG: AlpA family phage regulatory protein [Betaproteobacteria bacterium]|jgi:predicted DNA-binding transcriptional regulator AlpA|nr:AlpA family phage regulatory protein [Betaproteobacteria bacterium]